MTDPDKVQTKKSGVLLALITAGLFLAGTVQIYQVRYASGDIYPPYSSMLSGPLGLRALYESLQAQSSREVSQNILPLEQWKPSEPTTLILAGIAPRDFMYQEKEVVERYEAWAIAGHHLVFLLDDSSFLKTWQKDSTGNTNTNLPPRYTTDRLTWGLNFLNNDPDAENSLLEAYLADDFLPEAQDRKVLIGSPQIIVETATSSPTNTSWNVLLERDGLPVMLQRSWDKGTITVGSDAYALTNQGLFEHKPVEFIQGLIGGHSRIVFDETHLGTVMSPGVVSLMRRYHLEGVLFAFLLLAILYVWRQSAPLLPLPDTASEVGVETAGRGHLAGLVNLLSRSMTPAQIVREAALRWPDTLKFNKIYDPHRLMVLLEEIHQVPQALENKEDPLNIYRRIQSLMIRRNKK